MEAIVVIQGCSIQKLGYMRGLKWKSDSRHKSGRKGDRTKRHKIGNHGKIYSLQIQWLQNTKSVCKT